MQRFFHCAEQKIKGSYNWKRPTVKNDLHKFEGEDFEFKVIIQIKTELQYSHLSRENFNLINIQYFVYCEKKVSSCKKEELDFFAKSDDSLFWKRHFWRKFEEQR